MTTILKTPLTGPSAWVADDFADDNSWIRLLPNDFLAALDEAVQKVRSKGLAFPDFGLADFSIPGLRPELESISNELENGRGFVLLRGLPVDRYTEDEIRILLYGLGLNLGMPVRQNPRGDLLGLVAAIGDPADRNTRVYETSADLPCHTDPSDVVGLLCLRKAKRGGQSSLVSAASVYNCLLAECPEYLGLLYRPMYYAHLGDDPRSPVFSYHEGKLACRYLRQYIELGHELAGRPLSSIEIEALDRFDAAARDPHLRLDMMLEPGDLQLANNYTILHSRSEFEDYGEPARRRRMLRLWLKMPNARALAGDFPGRNGFPPPEK